MTTFDIALTYLITLGIGLLMLFMPALSRSSTFFAVTVPPGFPESEAGRSIRAQYRGMTLLATLGALAVITPLWWMLPPATAVTAASLAGPLIPAFGAIAAFVHCRGVAMEFREDDPARRREATLERDSLADIVPGRWWVHAGPYLVLLAAAGWLAWNWSAIPESVFVPANLPQGSFEPRGWFVVFGLPLTMLLTIAFCHAMMPLGLLIRRLPGHRRRVRSINLFILGIVWAMAVMGAWDSLVVLYGRDWIMGPLGMAVNIGAVLVVLLLPIWLLATGRFATPGSPEQGDRSPDEAWKLGLVYYNPDDPALWLEKRFGVGYTLNFARPMAWVIIAAILGGSAAIVVWAFSLG